VVLRPKKLEIREQIVKTVKEPKKQILCREFEPNPSKDRAMFEGMREHDYELRNRDAFVAFRQKMNDAES
jgi:hypothetical protein